MSGNGKWLAVLLAMLMAVMSLGLTAMDTYMKITAYGCGSETMTEARRELQRLDAVCLKKFVPVIA